MPAKTAAKPAGKTAKKGQGVPHRIVKKKPVVAKRTRIPLIVVTGYLGAGKTTLVRRLLPALNARGLKGLLLVNEIGETSVDGALLGDSGVEQFDLLGGCVCCSLQDDLYSSIYQGVVQYKPQYILLETSGLSEPASVVDAATGPGLEKEIECTDIVTVVDAANLELQLKHGELARRQAEYASALVLNKLDFASKKQVERAHELLSEMAPRVPVWDAEQARVDPAELLVRTLHYIDGKAYESHEVCDVCGEEGHDHEHHDHEHEAHDHGHEGHGHHHHGPERHAGHYALNISLPRELDKKELLAAVDALPEIAYRVKGFARVKGEPCPWIFQRVGSVPPQMAPFSLNGVPAPIGMVVIGPRLTEDMVAATVKIVGGAVVARTS
jgi:G3E family GTPase